MSYRGKSIENPWAGARCAVLSYPTRLTDVPRLSRRGRGRRTRRGIAVVLVLGLLAITLAISYATLRGQGTTSQLAVNNSRALDARVAAQSGLAAALRKISENAWAGVDVPLSANVTNHSWYQVTFTTGDAKLNSGDPLYAEYPFRLTIESVGYAADPTNAAVRSEHKSRCVVQLVRKKLTAPPPNWNTLTSNTVYQFQTKDVYVQFPVRIEGMATLMGRLSSFCSEYPVHTGARDRYLSDLNLRRTATLPDYRPFPETVAVRGFATTYQDPATMSLLTARLGVAVVEPALSPGEPVAYPGSVLKYRLYPGGKEYTPPVLQNMYGNPIQSVTIGPDPVTNPLGVFRSNGSLSVQNNVRITGTIVTEGSSAGILIFGTNVAIQAPTLPSLYGSSQSYQLPAALVLDDIEVNSGSGAQIEGAVVVWDKFELRNGSTATNFGLTGNLMVNELSLKGRTAWTQNSVTWGNDLTMFSLQLANPSPILFFPDYMQAQKGFAVKPTLTFSPNSSGVKPHWHDWSQAVYQPDPADPGLSWEVVRWEERP
jgi:hypothetical protein